MSRRSSDVGPVSMNTRASQPRVLGIGLPVVTMNAFVRAFNGLMCALFLLSVVVQWNDPDPLRWMAIYGAAFVVSTDRRAARACAHRGAAGGRWWWHSPGRCDAMAAVRPPARIRTCSTRGK